MSTKPPAEPPKPKVDPIVAAILAQKPDANVTDEEKVLEWKKKLLSRVQILHEGNPNDENDIRNRNPKYCYCWVYNNDQRIHFYEKEGYEIVTKVNDGVETNFERGGRHVKGDAVLMRADRDLVEAYNARRDLRAFQALEGKYTGIEGFGQNNRIPFFRK